MNRRTFIGHCLKGLEKLGLCLLIPFMGRGLMACGTEISGGQCSDSIEGNHSSAHSINVTQAQIDDGQDVTYNIQGDSDHDHTVTITAAQFATLASGGSITATSSATGHTHNVTISC